MIASLLNEHLKLLESLVATEAHHKHFQCSNHTDPGAIAWEYDRIEIIADLLVHTVGVSLGFIAAVTLLTLACIHTAVPDLAAASIYAVGLMSMLTLSAAYNLWPVSPTKWLLRRLDHSAIYLMIAATYTAFGIEAGHCPLAAPLLIAVWCIAAVGIAVKIALPGRLDRLSIAVYLGTGWSAVFLYDSAPTVLPTLALRLIVAGGMLYSVGVIFHAWERLRFQNAIWHCFVLLGTACHCAAVFDLVLT